MAMVTAILALFATAIPFRPAPLLLHDFNKLRSNLASTFVFPGNSPSHSHKRHAPCGEGHSILPTVRFFQPAFDLKPHRYCRCMYEKQLVVKSLLFSLRAFGND